MTNNDKNTKINLNFLARKIEYECPMLQFVNLLSGKWAIPILYRLMHYHEPVRFNTLKEALYPISQKELTRQLRLFEQRGLVTRTAYMEMPLRVEYAITPLGATLRSTLDALAEWMETHGKDLRV